MAIGFRPRRVLASVVLPVVAAFMVPLLAAQEVSSSVDLSVPVYVTVTDDEGRLVPDLLEEHFEVYDKGKRQTITRVPPITAHDAGWATLTDAGLIGDVVIPYSTSAIIAPYVFFSWEPFAWIPKGTGGLPRIGRSCSRRHGASSRRRSPSLNPARSCSSARAWARSRRGDG